MAIPILAGRKALVYKLYITSTILHIYYRRTQTSNWLPYGYYTCNGDNGTPCMQWPC